MWSDLYPDGPPHRVVLPTYPFERRRYWIPSDGRLIPESLPKAAVPTVSRSRPDEGSLFFFRTRWESAPLPTTYAHSAVRSAWPDLVFGFSNGLRRAFDTEPAATPIWIRPGRRFRDCGDEVFEIDPLDPGHYERVLTLCRQDGSHSAS